MTTTIDILVDLLVSADSTAERIGYPDPDIRHEYHRHFLMLLAQGYVQVFGTRDTHPDWVPHTGFLFPWGAANHDTIYGFAPIAQEGVYRVSGKQGTETVGTVMMRRGGANTGQVHGAPLGQDIDVNAQPVDAAGDFSFLVSRVRPDGYDGEWFALHEEATGFVSRHVTSDPAQKDGAWSLERLDRGPGPVKLTQGEVVEKTRLVASFVTRLNEFLMGHCRKLREGQLNAFVAEKYPDHGGIAAQLYYQGAWQMAEDEVLILESEIPSSIHYWSVQLLDPFFGAIDAIFHQSALNETQVRLDGDGRARFVVAREDPGVPNWLDPGGWTEGMMLWRWHSGSSYPQPTVKVVKRSALRAHLPADTPVVHPAERQATRSARIAHYQSRRRW